MKLKLKQNNSSIILRRLILLVISITLLLGITTVMAVGHQLLEQVDINAANIVKSMEKTTIDDDMDWTNWKRNSTLDISTSYVHVQNRRPNAKTKNYYSPNTKALIQNKKLSKIPIFKQIYYRQDVGFFYKKNGSARGINYQLWIKLNTQFDIIMRVVEVMMIILILTLIISPFYIKLISKKLTDPLEKLTNDVGEALEGGSLKLVKLSVPAAPVEIRQLAIAFNKLLDQIYRQSIKEKAFVSNAAHELRTPIATILSHTQLIDRRGKEHPEIVGKSLNYIKEESLQMQSLVNELLILSRADQAHLKMKEFNLSQLLVETANSIQPVLKQKLKTTIPEGITVRANQDSIGQVVNSLLTNAAKYSPEDSSIQLVLTESEQKLEIKVIDQGVGITEDEKPHVFERFYRGADVRGTTNGTGLGLSIAKQLAELNHGSVTVEDNSPRGSIFTLTIDKLAKTEN